MLYSFFLQVSSMDVKKGMPSPLGPTKTNDGFHFAVYSENATQLLLCLHENRSTSPTKVIEMWRTGNVWHCELVSPPQGFSYTFKACGPNDKKNLFSNSKHLLDPYAPCTTASKKWGHSTELLSGIPELPSFDWEGVSSPKIHKDALIIYEMHVRGFTQAPSSSVSHPGTFLGMIEKIPHLKKLGINAVELMPIFEFNERSHVHFNSDSPLYNFWGYSTVSFFAPMNRYGVHCAGTEFKELVKALHLAGIEVILDVVYNHTNEGNSISYYESFRGLDNATYYILSNEGEYHNYSGCGNTVNCNHPYVRTFIIDSLIHWVEEFHVDGFRFDLASILTRGEDGTPLSAPPLIEEICSHPKLQETKLIAEPWDCGGLYQVGSFPRSDRFSEWNGHFRDTVRRFIAGDVSTKNSVKDVLTGTPSVYGLNAENRAIHFVTAHDGFTLYDLVSYNEKHNEKNREDNRDGHNENLSSNSGVEGETNDPAIQHIRLCKMKSALILLLFSKGIPMLLMGDEYGHTRSGNNNAWCHDSTINHFLWERCESSSPLFQFIESLCLLRKQHTNCSGEYEFMYEEIDGVLACLVNKTLFFAVNVSASTAQVEIPEGFTLLLNEGFAQNTLDSYGSLVAEKR